MTYDIEFHARFNDAVNESKLSLRELSEKTGIPENTLIQYKYGYSIPKKAYRRKRLAVALGKPENYFLNRIAEPQNYDAGKEQWAWKNGFWGRKG